MSNDSKICSHCNEKKDISLYYTDKYKKNGYQRYCKQCATKDALKYYHKNRDKILKKKSIEYSQINPIILKRKTREHNIKIKCQKVGITVDLYHETLNKQDNKCLICKNPPGKKSLAIDHCHETGQFRGLLCTNCNTAIGLFKDNVNNLKEAINFLERKSYVS